MSGRQIPSQNGENRMNTALWTMHVVWGCLLRLNGFGKVCCYHPALWNQALQELPWFPRCRRHLFIIIGGCDFLGGVGLTLPAMTGVNRSSRRTAATGLTPVMLLAAVFHIMRGEYNFFAHQSAAGRGPPRSSCMGGCL
jgi:hypothetical protein